MKRKLLLENDAITFELENGILIGTGKPLFVDLSVAQKIVYYRLEIQNGKDYLLLIKMNKLKTITKEARDFLASEKGCEGTIAAAIYIDSMLASMIGNFFLRVSKPLVPTRIFNDENEAKEWLAQYAKKEKMDH